MQKKNIFKIQMFSIFFIFSSTNLFAAKKAVIDPQDPIFTMNLEECLETLAQNDDFEFEGEDLDQFLNFDLDNHHQHNKDLQPLKHSSLEPLEESGAHNIVAKQIKTKKTLTNIEVERFYHIAKEPILKLAHNKSGKKRIHLPLEMQHEIFTTIGLTKTQAYKWIYDRIHLQSRTDYLTLLEDITTIDIHLLNLRKSQTQKYPPAAIFSFLKDHLRDSTLPLDPDQALIVAIRFKLTVQEVYQWLSEKRTSTAWIHAQDFKTDDIKQNSISDDLKIYLSNQNKVSAQTIAKKAGVSHNEFLKWKLTNKVRSRPLKKKQKSMSKERKPFFTRLKFPTSPI